MHAATTTKDDDDSCADPLPARGESRDRVRLVCITTHGVSADLLMRGQLRYLRERGFDVTVIASPDRHLEIVESREGVPVVPVKMAREIAPWSDLVSLFALMRQLRRLRPEIVNASTPKAGLLGMIAAAAAGVPLRVYVVRGLRAERARGLNRLILEMTERVASGCAHIVLAVSPSLRAEYIRRRLTRPAKVAVIGGGSSNGIDVSRFAAGPRRSEGAAAIREQLRIPAGVPVIGFVGRFTRDKGIRELLDAWALVRRDVGDARLLLIGDFETGDAVDAASRRAIEEDRSIVRTGFVSDTAPYYAAMDVFVFPSYREGFPNSPLEAAASGVPTVGFAATGTLDAVEDGATGLLVPVGDAEALARGLLTYLRDPELRRGHGRAARERVLREFSNERIWSGMRELYESQLRRSAVPSREPAQ